MNAEIDSIDILQLNLRQRLLFSAIKVAVRITMALSFGLLKDFLKRFFEGTKSVGWSPWPPCRHAPPGARMDMAHGSDEDVIILRCAHTEDDTPPGPHCYAGNSMLGDGLRPTRC